jgi:hypothetical protein
MSKKTDILVNLKQQVMILKSQLDLINRKKMSISPGHHQSKSKGQRPSRTASRFDSNCLDGEIIGERGLRRFTNRQDTSHNLSELILNKSIEGKIPRISPYRKAEYIKTKENFDTEPMDLSPRQTALRNPLTG